MCLRSIVEVFNTDGQSRLWIDTLIDTHHTGHLPIIIHQTRTPLFWFYHTKTSPATFSFRLPHVPGEDYGLFSRVE